MREIKNKMKRNTIYRIALGGMLSFGLATVGHVAYKGYIDKKYTEKDFKIDCAGVAIMSGFFVYCVTIASKLDKKNKLEKDLTN